MVADPEAARSEWQAEFRSDISALLDDAVIEDAIDHARPLELPPRNNRRYHCFVDASAGRHDAFSCAIGHCEGNKGEETWVCDVIRGRLAPFDPRTTAEEYAALARSYGCTKIVGDAFAGEWVSAAFRDCGIRYEVSPLTKFALYLEALPGFNRSAVAIPNHERLLRELRGLERRVHRSGPQARQRRLCNAPYAARCTWRFTRCPSRRCEWAPSTRMAASTGRMGSPSTRAFATSSSPSRRISVGGVFSNGSERRPRTRGPISAAAHWLPRTCEGV